MRQAGLLLLAAGRSIRYNGNKLLDQVGNKKMYQHILGKLARVDLSPKMIVTAYEEIFEEAKMLGMEAIYNDRPGDGISRSIRLGLQQIIKLSPKTQGVLFCVSDQPYLKVGTILKIVDSFRNTNKNIVSASYNGISGNPVVFGKKYFDELMNLDGDVGGKKLLSLYANDVLFVEATEEKELEDIDYRNRR